MPTFRGTMIYVTDPLNSGPTIAKAVVAVTGSLGVAIAAALADGEITVWEIVLGAIAALGTGAAVWATSNDPARK
jgi:hypothetical protein